MQEGIGCAIKMAIASGGKKRASAKISKLRRLHLFASVEPKFSFSNSLMRAGIRPIFGLHILASKPKHQKPQTPDPKALAPFLLGIYSVPGSS